MNDLQFVAGGKLSGSPAIARNQLAIQLDGDTVRLHAELSNKFEKSGDTREFSLFAVDGKGHSAILARKSVGNMVFVYYLLPFYSLQLKLPGRRSPLHIHLHQN